ncbi:hypothetical protein PIB30_056694 [Stylosanthes scabra]|uniref:Uncharacterized protein n=1 Tax=Stylosanthes scabra TaxID=79078 RepID=A0ABU6RJI9_9FABA|nr:hypothetical protein [Stylosanthes scabra]
MYVTDETGIQQMFSTYHFTRLQVPMIELYVEFEHLSYTIGALGGDPDSQDYNTDSEEEFEANYKIIGPNVDDDEVDRVVEGDVVNGLSREDTFGEASFMFALDLEAMKVPRYPDYVNPGMFHYKKNLF